MTLPIQISQAELREISELERELPLMKKHLEDMKSSVLVLLREGASVESGRFDAKLVTRIGRPVPWKKLFIDKVGQAAADFLKRTFRTTVYFDVQVVEHATLPLWLNKGDGADAQN